MAESSNLDRIVVEQQVIERGMEDIDMDPLYEAISDNNWLAAEAFINRHPVGLGHEGMVQGWVGLLVQWAIFVATKKWDAISISSLLRISSQKTTTGLLRSSHSVSPME